MAILETIVIAFWAMLPAYVPQQRRGVGRRRPADRRRPDVGRQARTGRRKTWRGTAMGILAGLALAAVLTLVKPAASDALGFRSSRVHAARGARTSPAARCSGTSSRRSSNAEAAASAARCFRVSINWISSSSPSRWSPCSISRVVQREWFTLEVILVVVVLTPILHVTNMIAYKLGLKNEPW